MRIDAFLSYSSNDIRLAEEIVSSLESAGLTTWWDQKLRLAIDPLRKKIDEAIADAGCVIVLWSNSSVESNWVIAEAEKARQAPWPKLVHIRSENSIQVPLPFNADQHLTLVKRDGRIDRGSLDAIVAAVRNVIGVQGPNEHVIKPRILGDSRRYSDLAIDEPVPGTDTYVSFKPCDASGIFLLMRIETSDGWVRENIPTAASRHRAIDNRNEGAYVNSSGIRFLRVSNDVFVINDPVRPFCIQIGGLRSKRPAATPGFITGDIDRKDLGLLPLQIEWLSLTLAEIVSDTDSLRHLLDLANRQPGWSDEIRDRIRATIAKNPDAPPDVQVENCIFCDPEFVKYRRLSNATQECTHNAYVIANDFPFGPFFHYLAITAEPVHSWESLTYKQVCGLNLLLHDFLASKKTRCGAAGVEIGFNSTVRHLILGTRTRTSAGASIPHIHKHAWGMAPRSSNLAEQLIKVSQAYWNEQIDYLGRYLATLEESGYVIWKDDRVALYVPYGQCSMYEMQVMVRHPVGTFTELSIPQVESLSKAEYIVLQLFKELKIGSFNHVVLTKTYGDSRAPTFRFIEAFITREIDLAVSELSMLYVVDQHPWVSLGKILREWNSIKGRVLTEIG